MNEGHISERAAKFAEKLRPHEEKDERSADEKMAAFHKKWNRNAKAVLHDAKVKKDRYGR